MALSALDTLQYHDDLLRAGFNETQATVLVDQQKKVIDNHFATKQDLEQQRIELVHVIESQGRRLEQEIEKTASDIRQEMHEMGSDIRQEMQEMGSQLRKEMHEMEVRLMAKIHANSYLTIAVLGGLMTLFHFV